MGWAKYAEDNLEIFYERQASMGERWQQIISDLPLKKTSSITSQPVTSSADEPTEKGDRYIICRDCGRKILFSVRDQLFYEKKGWNPPKRCKSCRESRNTRYLMLPAY